MSHFFAIKYKPSGALMPKSPSPTHLPVEQWTLHTTPRIWAAHRDAKLSLAKYCLGPMEQDEISGKIYHVGITRPKEDFAIIKVSLQELDSNS